MENRQLMSLLFKISKNDIQRKQIVILSIIGGISLVGLGAMYFYNIRSTKRYKAVIVNNVIYQREILQKDRQIKEQENIINQLIADIESKRNLNNDLSDKSSVS